MNNTTEGKKNIFYTAMLILTLVITIIGTVYALVTLMSSQKEGSSAVYTGTLSIDYITGRKINCSLMPIYTPASVEDPNAYVNQFSVTSTGTLNSVVTINLDINYNEFLDGSIKYALYNSTDTLLEVGNIIRTGTITLAKKVLIPTNETATYTLQIWLEENNENQNTEMRKTLAGTINVDAIQEIE